MWKIDTTTIVGYKKRVVYYRDRKGPIIDLKASKREYKERVAAKKKFSNQRIVVPELNLAELISELKDVDEFF